MCADTQSLLLEIDNVVKTFGGTVALDGVSFGIAEGSMTGIIGPNGAGKTTLFDVISGVHKPNQGKILLNGTEIQGWAPPKIAQNGVGRTFQLPRVFGGMTVRENLEFVPMEQTGESISGALFLNNRFNDTVSREEAEIEKRSREIMDLLDIDHLADEYARGLSGGQRKLLEIGRVLMLDPEIILLDEPISGINPALAKDITEYIHEINARGKTFLMIDHEMRFIMNNCETVIVLNNGEVLSRGTPAEVQEDERVLEAYLGY